MSDSSVFDEPDRFDWGAVSRQARGRFANYPGEKQAIFAASYLNVFVWAALLISVVGGVLVAVYTDPASTHSDSFATRHPFALVGVVGLFVGVTQSLMAMMVLNFLKATLAFQAEAGAFFQAVKRASYTDE